MNIKKIRHVNVIPEDYPSFDKITQQKPNLKPSSSKSCWVCGFPLAPYYRYSKCHGCIADAKKKARENKRMYEIA